MPLVDKQDIVRVYDMSGRLYQCPMQHFIGKGGQGMVLRTLGDKYTAVKLACRNDEPIEDEEGVRTYRKRIARIRHLPVPDALRLSVPIAILQNAAGYVMRLLGDMASLKSLIPSYWNSAALSKVNVPQWLQDVPEGVVRGALSLYAETGGLRTRVDALLQLATTLARLHACGIVFGDLSPNNVQISTEGELQVWLIDIDNLCYESEGESICVYTPKYCAPEVANGTEGISQASDAYSFALLAFELLTTSHPFHGGKAVMNSNWDEEDSSEDSIEAKADKGQVPWIYDTEDISNALENPNSFHSYTLSGPLFALFQLMFGQGRTSPVYRPPLWMWRSALAWTLDRTINCPSCGMGMVITEHNEKNCPFCEHPFPSVIECRTNDKLLFAYECSGKTIIVPRRIFCPCSLERDASLLRISCSGRVYHIDIMDDRTRALFALDSRETHPFSSGIEVSEDELQAGIHIIIDAPGAWDVIFIRREL